MVATFCPNLTTLTFSGDYKVGAVNLVLLYWIVNLFLKFIANPFLRRLKDSPYLKAESDMRAQLRTKRVDKLYA